MSRRRRALRATRVAVVFGVFVVCGAGAGCHILGLAETVVFPCEFDEDCDDAGAACVDHVCVVAEGEGEGEGEEGEGEEGEGEGEDPFVSVFDVRDPVDDPVLVAGVGGVVVAGEFVAAAGEFTPVQGRFATTTAQTVSLAGGLGSDVVFELFARTPSAFGGEEVLVDALVGGGDGVLIASSGSDLIVDVGQWELRWPAAPGAWHHLVCAARGDADGSSADVEVVCVLDGVERVAAALDDGTHVSGATAARLLPDAGSDAAVGGFRVWNVVDPAAWDDDDLAAFAPSGLVVLEQRRLHRALGLFGLLPRRATLDEVEDPGDGLPVDGKIVLNVEAVQTVAPTWPRREPFGLLLEPPRTQSITTTCGPGFTFGFGVDLCELGAGDTVVLGDLPAQPSVVTFFASGTDVSGRLDGVAIDCGVGEESLFGSCLVPGGGTALTLSTTAGVTIVAPTAETGPVTTRPSPTQGRARRADRQEVEWSANDPLIIATLVFNRDPVDFFNIVGANHSAGDAACRVDDDCAASDICDGGACGRKRQIGRLTYDGDNMVLEGDGVGTQTVPVVPTEGAALVFLRRVNQFTCPEDLDCAAFDAPGGARLELGPDANVDATTGRAFVIALSVLKQ